MDQWPRRAGPGSTSLGAVPATLVLVCGVFGNVVDDDIRNTETGLLDTRRADPALLEWLTAYNKPLRGEQP